LTGDFLSVNPVTDQVPLSRRVHSGVSDGAASNA
jgi:hypothetical protein